MKAARDGFTIVELLVAIVVLSIGLLAMLGSSAFHTRTITRDRDLDYVAIYAARRLELLRTNACRHPVDSSEAYTRGGDTLAVNAWAFTATKDATNSVDGYRIAVTSQSIHKALPAKANSNAFAARATRQDKFEEAISCAQ